MHGQPSYIGNCDIPVKNMVTRQEHHSGIGGSACCAYSESVAQWVLRGRMSMSSWWV